MLERLTKMIKEAMPDVDVSNITLETKLFDDLHFDSLAMMMLSMTIEDEFGVTFDGTINFVTVKDVVDYLESLNK